MKSVDFKRGKIDSGKNFQDVYVEVMWDRQPHKLLTGAGSRDHIYVAREGDIFYVMVTNRGLDYIVVSEYNMRKLDRRDPSVEAYAGDGVVAIDDASEVLAEHFRKPWDEYSDVSLLRGVLNLFG